MREVSRVASHHASTDSAVQSTTTSSTTSIWRPPPSTTERSRSGSPSRNGPGASWSGGSVKPRSSAARPGGGDPGIHARARPDREHDPGTRAQDPRDLGGSALHVGDEHQPEAAEDAVDGRSRAASGWRRPRPRTRSLRARASAARRRATSTISGATSVESSSPPGWISGSSPEPGLAGPGREVEDPLPGSGSSSSTIRSESAAVARANSSRCRSQPAATLRQSSTCSAALSPMPPRP